MKDPDSALQDSCSVQAVLKGGPSSIPKESRTQIINSQDRKIKISHYGGYEHFELANEADDNASSRQVTFRWTMRTEVAE